ncbi:Putative cytochrome P450 [Mycobacteroides abscessus subsp. bolletii]|uniref:cytochrome P450 n=1 Tax=Mycobacteroides abscessus TaxID=36809 RepID=UPI00092B9D13|nr:cytochrome P450 [Mycobacteroides abscessus]SHX52869.1 Putative cytochrome P450 [Mycobacteroides abscessus subsp. bolletii]SKP62203.1 Putative cytochrome P450 [Mycobacteroides abscessus subsp. bolletii]SKP73636.1 Putative cytochrome P450 [Mycobacteroides abscessus subsp. bolletii]SKQ21213.1 Putative cytochrome P450 [Mycobacteroides abscessus subsp. bolletii]
MIARDPFGYLASLVRRYGDVVQVPVPGITMILLNNPAHIERILVKEVSNYITNPALKDAVTDLPYLPPFFATLEGEPWRRVRRLLTPKFANRHLGGTSSLIADAVWDGVAEWDAWADTGQTVDLQHELHLLGMAVLLRSMFTKPADRRTVSRVVSELETNARGMALGAAFSWAPTWLPRPYAKRRRQSSKWLADYIDAMIADRIRHPVESDDLLNSLLDATFDDGSKIDDVQLRAELRGLLFAGFETTSTAVSWTFAMLDNHREALEKAYLEVDDLIGVERPGVEQFPALPWIRACFEESQRFQGNSMTAMSRKAVADDVIDGYRIPEGTIVGWSAPALYKDRRFWREPDRFDPSRFLGDEVQRYAFPLFSFGPHRCLGVNFAYIQGVQIVAAVLQRYRYKTVAGYEPRHQHNFGAARLKGGLPVTLERRR